MNGVGYVSLDERFGVPRPPLKVDDWEIGRSPKSNTTLSEDIAQRLSAIAQQMDCTLLHGFARSVTFLWVMEVVGTLRVCVEELAETPSGLDLEGYPRRRGYPSHPVREKKLGHPTLVAGDDARIAGELFDLRSDGLRWYINVKSGRYCKKRPPSGHQIAQILALFQSLLGKDVRFDDIRTA